MIIAKGLGVRWLEAAFGLIGNPAYSIRVAKSHRFDESNSDNGYVE